MVRSWCFQLPHTSREDFGGQYAGTGVVSATRSQGAIKISAPCLMFGWRRSQHRRMRRRHRQLMRLHRRRRHRRRMHQHHPDTGAYFSAGVIADACTAFSAMKAPTSAPTSAQSTHRLHRRRQRRLLHQRALDGIRLPWVSFLGSYFGVAVAVMMMVDSSYLSRTWFSSSLYRQRECLAICEGADAAYARITAALLLLSCVQGRWGTCSVLPHRDSIQVSRWATALTDVLRIRQ